MKWFIRNLNGVQLCIGVESSLYNHNIFVFRAILNTYYECDKSPSGVLPEYTLVIMREGANNGLCYICDTSGNGWIQDLINYIEDWHANILNCTVFHGSCVVIGGKGIMILGDRKRGKSTLTGYLTIIKGMQYLDDDCIYYYEEKFVGFNMPISVRNNVDNLPADYMVATTVDVDDVQRQLYCSSAAISTLETIDYIVFPQHDKKSTGEIKILSNHELLAGMVIRNIRHHKNVETMCRDLINIIKGSKAVHIKYSDSQTAHELLVDTIFSNLS